MELYINLWWTIHSPKAVNQKCGHLYSVLFLSSHNFFSNCAFLQKVIGEIKSSLSGGNNPHHRTTECDV